MPEALTKPDDDLYERDFYAWTREQAANLRARAHNAVDWDRLAEELETLGRREKRELESRLGVVILHLLKWRYQPSHQSRSWHGTIAEQRRRLAKRLGESPSLMPYPQEALSDVYQSAVVDAIVETGFSRALFPAMCPFTVEEILDPDFYPEAE